VEIEKGFSKLFRAIRIWIGSIESDPDIFHTTLQQNTETLTKLILGRGMNTVSVSDGSGRAWVDWLGQHQTRTYIILSLLIWDFLERRIFVNHYPVGVLEQTAQVFDDVVEVLKAERYVRGERLAIPANKWRSDTVLTLTKTPSFQQQRDKTLKGLCDELTEKLSRFVIGVDHDSLSQHLKDLETLVIYPAAKLHQHMRCSRYEYVITVPPVLPGEPLRKKGLSEWTLLDVGTWAMMGISGEVLGVLACLYPKIVRRGIVEGEADVEVIKPVVLAYDRAAPRPPQRVAKLVNRRSYGSLRR